MNDSQKAALRRKLEELEAEVVTLRHYINIWPGVNVSRERAYVENVSIFNQNHKVNRIITGITNDISIMLRQENQEPHPNCRVCEGKGWFWGGERGEKTEDCDCYDAYMEEKF